MFRNGTKKIRIGSRVIGGGNEIIIQSMTNTRTEDAQGTIEQIKRLTAAGCEIIRCAVPTMEAAEALGEIKKIYRFLWLRTFILIIVWQSLRLKTERIRFGSIREISVTNPVSGLLWRKRRKERCLSV